MIKTEIEEIKNILVEKNLTISCAESCTGGLISSYLTDIDGASNFIEQNFVTYAKKAKNKFLNVKFETMEKYGVVSNETAKEMAQGLFQYADVTISTTGYAAPTGGDSKNPPKTVYIGFGLKEKNIIKSEEYHSNFKTRCEIKKDFAQTAIKKLLQFLKNNV